MIEKYHGWLYRLANDLLWADSSARRTLSVDDLVQEGRVAMWRASLSFDPKRGHLPAHLTNAARKRMLDVVMGKKPCFGTEGNRGRVKVPEAALRAMPEPGDPDEPLSVDLQASREPSDPMRRAMAAMSPSARQYVESVFWGSERLRRDRAAWREAEAAIRAEWAA